MTIKGAQNHSDRLKAMTKENTKIVRALYAAGQNIEIDAEISITSGSISGEGHVASLPGQPPNADTRVLDGNIETEIIAQNPPTVTVTSKAPYAAFLEFGSSKAAERPYMRPAVARNKDKVAAGIRDAVNISIRRG